MTSTRVGFVGLGLMGAPMAAKSRRPDGASPAGTGRLPPLKTSAVRRAASVAALRDEPVIIFMLPDLSYIEDAATSC